MRLPSLFRSKKLRATTARRLGAPDEMDYEEMSEPNMKLSRALLIVLVLHVVAVAGIIAFNTIKSRQVVMPPLATAKTVEKKTTVPSVSTAETTTKAKDESPKAPVKEERKAIPVKPIAESTPKAESSKKTYMVVKGDTPVSIAKKFKITSAQLLAANGIEDARKLKIGQKLMIPAPKEKAPSKEKKKSKKSE
jgi:LysM repeat protein